MAKLLSQKKTYSEIEEITKASTAQSAASTSVWFTVLTDIKGFWNAWTVKRKNKLIMKGVLTRPFSYNIEMQVFNVFVCYRKTPLQNAGLKQAAYAHRSFYPAGMPYLFRSAAGQSRSFKASVLYFLQKGERL